MEKPSSRKGKTPMKMCIACGRILAHDAFYGNKDFASQACHDAWCKECALQAVDRDTLRAYCWYNNRQWSDEFYEAALKKALYALASKEDYLSASDTRKQKMVDAMACKQFFSMMNLASFYRYRDNVGERGEYREFDAAAEEEAPLQAISHDDGELLYSREWNGMYTQREIDYLDDYYERLEEGFVLDNQNIQDYARKVAKASLDADTKYNRMRQGQGNAGDWKEAQAIFDNLSKSANFAACKRKPSDNAGMGALGLIVQKIEASGKLQTKQVKFPKDDIDLILEDFSHTLAAVGLEQSI